MPKSKNPDWITWNHSIPQQRLLEDLSPGGILFQKDHVTAQEAWSFYKNERGFENVVFSQFEARLKGHRQQVNKHHHASQRDLAALQHDRQLYPRQARNHRGELVFDMHPARDLLRADVKEGIHKNMSVEDFQKTRPVEYGAFPLKVFRERVKQTVNYWKHVNWMESKRKAEKRDRDVDSPFV